MKKIIDYIIYHLPGIYKGFLFLISIILIVQIFPRQAEFQYEFQKFTPWLHDDILAPFDFPILKTEEELEKEKKELLDDFKYYFKIDHEIYDKILIKLHNDFEQAWEEKYSSDIRYDEKKKLNRQILFNIVDHLLYDTGIILLENRLEEKDSGYKIRLRVGQDKQVRQLSDFYTVADAGECVDSQLEQVSEEKEQADVEILKPLLESALVHNVFYDDTLNQQAIEEKFATISPSIGMVQQGEKIIWRGDLITNEKYRVLMSFMKEYNRQLGDISPSHTIYTGQFILVSISIIVLSLFLRTFRRDVYDNNRKIILILVSIVFMVFLTSIVVKHSIDYLYLVPVCIIPIVIRSFFDNRLALYVHITTIILIGFMVPKSFQFVFLQFIAGIVSIFSMVTLQRRSQIFITSALIFLTYAAVFSGLSLVQRDSLYDFEYMNYAYFAGSAVLTLFAYPTIFMLEKIFGMSTDFSLLELSDTNNKLLRDLSMKAPGTFQHSLQVANLAEEAIIEIGGNPLLARTGALYHDIGKMDAPLYFTENQLTGVNPHEEIPYEESAEIIIKHIIKGVEKARKAGLPEYITDFIRTHHGTTTARYFYSMSVKNNEPDKIDREKFTYPGPKPFNKETSVLMMADSVEAASRSMSNPDEDSINDLVDNIIDNQVKEKQFDDANITFKDISSVKKIFKQTLKNIFHVRITYPSES